MRVFDFDNTIYDGESGMDIFLYYLKRDPKGVAKFVPKFMEGFLKYKRHLITIEEVKTEYCGYYTFFCKKSQTKCSFLNWRFGCSGYFHPIEFWIRLFEPVRGYNVDGQNQCDKNHFAVVHAIFPYKKACLKSRLKHSL